jgi:hypothetical protein
MTADLLIAAARYGLAAGDLDWHVGSEHGVAPDDETYGHALTAAALCLLTRVCTRSRCTCDHALTGGHGIDCMITAHGQGNGMTNQAGDVFYPADPADAAFIAQHHGARFVDHCYRFQPADDDALAPS